MTRCTVERVMKLAEIQGVRRVKKTFTTVTDKASFRPRGAVNRDFTVDRPNASAETIFGLIKTELIRQYGPWHNLDEVEYATLT